MSHNLHKMKSVGAAVALSLTIGLFGAAAPASAAPTATVATRSVAAPTTSVSTSTTKTLVSNQASGSTTVGKSSSQLRVKIPTSAIKKIISYLLKYAKISYSALKSVVKAGYTAFKKLWDKLPGWVRFIISNIAGASAYDIFVALYHYFF